MTVAASADQAVIRRILLIDAHGEDLHRQPKACAVSASVSWEPAIPAAYALRSALSRVRKT